MIAELKNELFFDFENGTELLQYVGDEILKYWHLDVDSFVKWGNLVFEDGTRSPGAMFQLENVQKILKDKLYLFKK